MFFCVLGVLVFLGFPVLFQITINARTSQHETDQKDTETSVCGSQPKSGVEICRTEIQKKKLKQRRNLMWSVQNFLVFTVFPAHVHFEQHSLHNK